MAGKNKEKQPKQNEQKDTAKAVEKEGCIVKKGDKVCVEYTGSFDDGTVFDASEKHGKPLEFSAGTGQVIPGFDNAIVGMKVGEEKTVKIIPSEAYGDVNPELVKDFPRERLPKEQEPQPGMMLVIGLPNGAQLPAKIVEVKNDIVKIDLNHPLAGKTLNFKLKVAKISNE